MDIEIGEIDSRVHVMDEKALVSPQITQQLMRELLRQVAQREDHARRVQRERDVDAGRTAKGPR